MENEKIQFVKISHNNRKVDGILYEPKGIDKYPIVIFSHGYNGYKTDFDSTAKYLVRKGIGAFSFTFCGGSTRDESGMATTEMTIFSEIEDLKAVISYVKNLSHVDSENIFTFGGSQGGLVTALTVDEMSDEIKGMVLLYPAFCIPENWTMRFPKKEDIPDEEMLWGMKLGRVFFETILGFDVYVHIGKFENPVLIMHGDKDTIVDKEFSQRVKQKFKNVRLEIFDGEGHGFSPEGTERMTQMLYDFIKENI